ncbi:MAG: PspC domain-containing protein, partial [Bacteroidales bacterium]|nr:PspC domain-containing protein [Bacteroidales bacterium]
MKKVEKVSIGRYAFSIEIDAYEAISKYLEDLRKFYDGNPNLPEILESIEERIAELFIEKKGDGVITEETVTQVIDIIGRPEMLDNEEGESVQDKDGDKKQSVRKLHRNIEDKLLGGVCSGLAAYFQMDSTLMRFIWIAFLILGCIFETIFLGPILAYLICWAIIPPANTVEKRYAMKGESISIDNITTSSNTKSHQSDFWRILGRVISIF